MGKYPIWKVIVRRTGCVLSGKLDPGLSPLMHMNFALWVSVACLPSDPDQAPPMLPILYNSNYQIVQTQDHVMILVEMVHDARIIPIDKNHH